MAGRQSFKDERSKHLDAIGQTPLPLPSPRREDPIPYTDDLAQEAVDLGCCGLSETEIAAHWAVDMQTMQTWREAHTELDAAMSRARVGAEAWWEEKARRAMELRDNRFPAGAWAMVMKARFPAYRERLEIQHNIDIRQLVMVTRRAPELPSEQTAAGRNQLIEHAPVRLSSSPTASDEVEIRPDQAVRPGEREGG